MNPVYIDGIGILSPRIRSVMELHEALGRLDGDAAERSAVGDGGWAEPFDFPLGVPPSKVRRAPRYVKMAVAAAAQAVTDADVTEEPARIGTIFSTGYGPVESNVTFADSVAEGVPALVSPTVFSYTVPNSCLGQVCIVNGFQGPSTLLIGGDPIEYAALLMAGGKARHILVGAVEEPTGELRSSFDAAGHLRGDVLADGAAMLMLSAAASERSYCRILRCRHCYISCDENAYGEPTMQQCEDIVRQMKAANIHMVDLTGGEPLVRRDFWDLVDLLMDEKIYIEEIFSNGLLITDAFLDKLERRNIKLNSFLLSYDGVGWHDWMRGLSGAEETVIRTIKRLKSRGYGVIVTTVLHEQSMDCLTDTYHRMKALDVDYWRVADVVNTGNWKKTQNTEVKTTALLDAYVDLIAQMKRDRMPFRAVKLAGCFSAHGADYSLPALGGCGTKAQENEHLCEASKLFPHLLPDGRLLPCMPMCGTEMEEHAANILTGDYDISKALIDSPLGKYMQYTYRDVFLHEEECRRCPHKYQCNRCPATSLLYGSLFAKSPLTCAFIKQNYAERIRDVMERAG